MEPLCLEWQLAAIFPVGAVNRGVAYESDLLVVKMGIPRQDSFPRTTERCQRCRLSGSAGYTAWKTNRAQFKLWKIIMAHTEAILCWKLIWTMCPVWGKNVICVGMGNNGNDALHTGGKLSPGEIQEIELELVPLSQP